MTDAIVIIGSTGHAKVCIELLRSMNMPVACCVGDMNSADRCLGVSVFKDDEHLVRLRNEGYRFAFVAIGANPLRERMGAVARDLGYELVNAISPTAVVSPTARLGKGIAIMAGAVINADASIGDLAIINTSASVDHDGRIGVAVHIAPQCALAGNVTVGDRAFLGIGCAVIPDVTIGNDVVAGAGSIIVSNVPPNLRIAGVPAKALTRKNQSQ